MRLQTTMRRFHPSLLQLTVTQPIRTVRPYWRQMAVMVRQSWHRMVDMVRQSQPAQTTTSHQSWNRLLGGDPAIIIAKGSPNTTRVIILCIFQIHFWSIDPKSIHWNAKISNGLIFFLWSSHCMRCKVKQQKDFDWGYGEYVTTCDQLWIYLSDIH